MVFVECQGQQFAAGAVFVGAPSVAVAAGQKDHLFLVLQGESLQLDVLELYFHGGSGVELQSENAAGAEVFRVVVRHVRHHDAINLVKETVTPSDDVVIVPVVLFNVLLQLAAVTQLLNQFRFPVGADFGLLATASEDAAAPFVIMSTAPDIPRLDVGLVAADNMVTVICGPVLNSGIKIFDAVFQL